MKMRNLHKAFAIAALSLTLGAAHAQMVSPVDFMRMNPFQLYANPATNLPYKSFGAFAVGNVNVNFRNSGIHYDNLFDFDSQGRPAVLNLKQFANSLKDENNLNFNAKENVFFAGFRVGPGMLTVGYDIHLQGALGFDRGLFDLLANGNGAFVGEDNPATANLSIGAKAYQEWAVGYQMKVTKKLSVGARVKLLFGTAHITTDAFSLKLVTDADTYALRLYEDIGIDMALPLPLRFEDGRLKTAGRFGLGSLFANPGFGLDLGAEYQIDDKFGIAAAVTDLGFISWKSNAQRVVGGISEAGQFYDNGSFFFEGFDMDQLQRIVSDEYYRELFVDTLQSYFRLQSSESPGYTTSLRTNLMLRGNYDIDARNRLSAQLLGCFREDGFRPAMTLAYSGSFNEMFDVCATYTVMKGSYDNIGLGVAGNFGTFHIYLTTNNLIGLFKPLNASAMNAQVGIVFNLRLPEKRYIDDSEMPEYLE